MKILASLGVDIAVPGIQVRDKETAA
jgi:hypothetical protein